VLRTVGFWILDFHSRESLTTALWQRTTVQSVDDMIQAPQTTMNESKTKLVNKKLDYELKRIGLRFLKFAPFHHISLASWIFRGFNYCRAAGQTP